MWIILLVGGVIGAQLLSSWAQDQEALRIARRDARPRDMRGGRAFWRSQVGVVGRYRFVGMPETAALVARLKHLTEDHELILINPTGRVLARVLFWDVSEYNEVPLPEMEEEPSIQ